jgi:5-methylcytosine-specific restriction endonuclease McrA
LVNIDKFLETFENRPIDVTLLLQRVEETDDFISRDTYLMGNSYQGRPKLRRLQKPAINTPIDQILEKLRTKPSSSSSSTYREPSLKIHGLICAKCAREFDDKTRHLLTVHHKDGNHHNNPPDGSNWENLCSYCHDDEHSRGILGDYVRKAKEDKA